MTRLRYSDGPDMALLTAVFTPFTETGELALDVVPKQADDLLAWGSAAAYVGGTAGEGASLSTEERMELVERWCEVADGRLDVIVHVGHSSLTEARRLAAHAEWAGVRAISAVAPYFHRPETVDALVDVCAAIADAAPTLPFTYYHIPSMTGVHLRASDVLQVAREKIPTFAGIKFAHNDMVDLQRCLHLAGGEQEVFVGVAKLVLAAWQWGARAAIGSVYNFAGPLFRRMLDHAARGELEEARACQVLAQQVIDAAARHGGGELVGFKAMGSLTGVDCGGCRPPLVSPGPDQVTALRAEVTGLGFPGGNR